jgi:hypothetical protein
MQISIKENSVLNLAGYFDLKKIKSESFAGQERRLQKASQCFGRTRMSR